jgi:hypothetical protein
MGKRTTRKPKVATAKPVKPPAKETAKKRVRRVVKGPEPVAPVVVAVEPEAVFVMSEPEPIVERVVVEPPPPPVGAVVDFVIVASVPESGVDAEGRPVMTGRRLYLNAAGEEVPLHSRTFPR